MSIEVHVLEVRTAAEDRGPIRGDEGEEQSNKQRAEALVKSQYIIAMEWRDATVVKVRGSTAPNDIYLLINFSFAIIAIG